MLVYNDVTSIETRMVLEGRGFMDSIFERTTNGMSCPVAHIGTEA
jgi:hypothetical protein